MKNNFELPKRKPTRLKDYDYSQNGAYFITICTCNRKPLFGTITNGTMQLSEIGKIAEQELLLIGSRYTNIKINKHVIMPNHIHMIILIEPPEGIYPFNADKKYDISNVVGKFKAGVSRIARNAFMRSEIWQRSFHDHIIRGEKDYRKIWEYIDTNLLKWEFDRFYTNETGA